MAVGGPEKAAGEFALFEFDAGNNRLAGSERGADLLPIAEARDPGIQADFASAANGAIPITKKTIFLIPDGHCIRVKRIILAPIRHHHGHARRRARLVLQRVGTIALRAIRHGEINQGWLRGGFSAGDFELRIKIRVFGFAGIDHGNAADRRINFRISLQTLQRRFDLPGIRRSAESESILIQSAMRESCRQRHRCGMAPIAGVEPGRPGSINSAHADKKSHAGVGRSDRIPRSDQLGEGKFGFVLVADPDADARIFAVGRIEESEMRAFAGDDFDVAHRGIVQGSEGVDFH